jgi:hypothetical protein
MGERTLKTNFVTELLGRIKIKYQLAAIPFLFLICMTALMLYTLEANEQQHQDNQLIEVANYQQMLNQQIFKEVLLTLMGQKNQLNAHYLQFNQVLNVLQNGGTISLDGIEIALEANTYSETVSYTHLTLPTTPYV